MKLNASTGLEGGEMVPPMTRELYWGGSFLLKVHECLLQNEPKGNCLILVTTATVSSTSKQTNPN